MQQLRALPTKSILTVLVVLIAIVALIFVGAQISGEHTILDQVAKIDVARGLITFLIAFVTVVIALILTLSVFFDHDAEYKERFNLGKEILIILIGVLGTIVGFYFGSTAQSPAETLSATPLVISNEQPQNGENLTIMGLVGGGSPPYVYAISAQPEDIFGDMVMGTSVDGVIQQRLPISTSITSETGVTLHVQVMDSAGNAVTIESKRITVIPSATTEVAR